MRKVGNEVINKIESLITSKSHKKFERSPNRHLNGKSPVIHKVVQQNPHREKSVSPKRQKSPNIYKPREKQIKILETQTKMIYQQLQKQQNFKIQNPHSFFLNKKNPKPPIYERAQEIIRQRQAYLQLLRQDINKKRQDEQYRQYQEYLKNLPPKKIISKEQAFEITDRLYKDHFTKANRMNKQKLQRYKQDAKNYRQKPMISTTSKQLYQIVAEKNQLQIDIIDRFGHYQIEKKLNHQELEKSCREKFMPFKPQIAVRSREINTSRNEGQKLSRSKHCTSCQFIKNDTSNKSVSRSRNRQSFEL